MKTTHKNPRLSSRSLLLYEIAKRRAERISKVKDPKALPQTKQEKVQQSKSK